MRPVVWIEDPSLKAQEERLASGALTASERGERVASVAALRSALENPDTVAFLDGAALGAINALRVEARPDRVIGVWLGNSDGSPMIACALRSQITLSWPVLPWAPPV